MPQRHALDCLRELMKRNMLRKEKEHLIHLPSMVKLYTEAKSSKLRSDLTWLLKHNGLQKMAYSMTLNSSECAYY